MEPIRPKEESSIPPWVKRMVRSKYFWITLAIVIPFVVLWIKEGLMWAIITFLILGGLILFLTSRRRRSRRYYVIDEDDYDEDEEIIIESGRRTESSDRIRDLYFPKGLRNIHQEGLNNLGQRQRDDLKRTMRRLRRLR